MGIKSVLFRAAGAAFEGAGSVLSEHEEQPPSAAAGFAVGGVIVCALAIGWLWSRSDSSELRTGRIDRCLHTISKAFDHLSNRVDAIERETTSDIINLAKRVEKIEEVK